MAAVAKFSDKKLRNNWSSQQNNVRLSRLNVKSNDNRKKELHRRLSSQQRPDITGDCWPLSLLKTMCVLLFAAVLLVTFSKGQIPLRYSGRRQVQGWSRSRRPPSWC